MGRAARPSLQGHVRGPVSMTFPVEGNAVTNDDVAKVSDWQGLWGPSPTYLAKGGANGWGTLDLSPVSVIIQLGPPFQIGSATDPACTWKFFLDGNKIMLELSDNRPHFSRTCCIRGGDAVD